MEARILEPPPDPDRDPEAFYHPHGEDRVPVSGMHDAIVLYLESAVGVHLPDRWVAADLCCYWIPRNNRVYLGPDVFVAACARPHPLPSSFRNWEHGPLLLVIEVGSRTSLRRDVGPKLERYAEGLLPGEHLYYDADHRDLCLHRHTAQGYERILPDAEGKLWSETVGVAFAIVGDGFLRAYDSYGQPLPSHAEEARFRQEAERRAEEAERSVRSERRRTTTEKKRAEEAERRAAEAEQRVRELEEALARRIGQKPAD